MLHRGLLNWIAAVALLPTAGIRAGWELVEDFEALPPGPVSKVPRWLSNGDLSVFEIAADSGGRFLRSARSEVDWQYWWTALALPRPVPPDATAVTVYARFRWSPQGKDPLDLSFGLTRGQPTKTADFQLYRVQAAPTRAPDGLSIRLRNGEDLANAVLGLAPDTWFQCWLVCDNKQGRFRFYLAPDKGDATSDNQLGGDCLFRSGEPSQGPLTHFAVMRASKKGVVQFDLDNLWIDYQGANLTSPRAAPPKPAAR